MAMKPYKNLSGNGGIVAYELTPRSIILTFPNSPKYEYNYIRPGTEHVRNMKALAERGRGLTTYVNKYVRDNYFRTLE